MEGHLTPITMALEKSADYEYAKQYGDVLSLELLAEALMTPSDGIGVGLWRTFRPRDPNPVFSLELRVLECYRTLHKQKEAVDSDRKNVEARNKALLQENEALSSELRALRARMEAYELSQAENQNAQLRSPGAQLGVNEVQHPLQQERQASRPSN